MSASQIHPRVNITKYGGVDTTLGQKPMATSVPVVLANDQTPVEVTSVGSSTVRIYGELDDVATAQPMEGAYASVRITALRGAHVSLRKDDGTGSEWKGQSAMAESVPVVIANNQSAVPISNAQITTIATAVQIEDSAHASASAGMFALAVRNDSSVVRTNNDGDYSSIAVDSAGRVQVVGSQADDSAFAVSSRVHPVAGVYASVIDTLDDGDLGAPALTAYRALHSSLRDALGNPVDIDDAGVDTINPVDMYSVLARAFGYVFNGTTWDRQRGDISNGLDVDVTRVQGTVQVQSNSANLATEATLASIVTTDDGAFTVGTDKVVPVGGTYRSVLDNVNDGDIGALAMTIHRSLFVSLREPVNGNAVSMADPDADAVGATDTYAPLVRAPLYFLNGGGTFDRARGDTTNGLDVDVTRVQGTVAVSAASLPLPTGAATLAEQQTQTAHLSNIVTSVQLLDDVVQTEDEAHVTGHKGIMPLSVRKDAATALASTDGDYQPLITNAAGRLYVETGTVNVNAVQSGTWEVSISEITVADFDTGAGTSNEAVIGLVIPGSGGRQIVGNTGVYLPVSVQNTVPVSGTVTANQGGAPWTQRLQDGDSSVLADVLDLTNSNPLTVAIVDSNGTQITSFGGGTQFAEDAAHVSGDVGTLALARRIDAAASSAGTSGDYATLNVDGNGRLYVALGIGSTAVAYTASGLSSIGVGMLSGIMGLSDDDNSNAVYTSGEDKHLPFRQTNTGAAWTNLRDLTGNEVNIAEPDDDTTTATDNYMLGVRSYLHAYDGSSSFIRMRGDATNGLDVDVTRVQGTVAISAASLPLPTGAATLAEQQSQTTHLATIASAVLVDDAAFTVGTSKVVPAGATYRSVLDSVNDNDIGALAMTINRSLHVSLRDPVNGNPTSAADPDADALSPTDTYPVLVRSLGYFYNGSGFDRARGDTTNGLDVDVTRVSGIVSVQSNGANLATQATLANVETSVQLIDDVIQVDDGTGFTIGTSKVAMIGGVYKATPDSVDDGDAGAFHMTQKRALHVHLVTDNGDSMITPGDGTFSPTGKPMPFQVSLVDGGSFHLLSKGGQTAASSLPVAFPTDYASDVRKTLFTELVAVSGTTVNAGVGAVANGMRVALATEQNFTKQDDAAFNDETDYVAVIGAFYQATGDAVNDGDVGALRMTDKRVMMSHRTTTDGTDFLQETARTQIKNAEVVDSTTEEFTDSFPCTRSTVEVEFTIAKTGSPTRIQFVYYFANDGGTNWARVDHGWEQAHYIIGSAVSGTIYRTVSIPRRGAHMRIGLLCSGTVNGSNYFTISVHARCRET